MSDTEACDHSCTCGHMQADHSTSGHCNACGDDCDHNDGHYVIDCLDGELKVDPVAEARRLVAEDEQRKTQECLAEIEAVLAKYGRKLQISQPQITIIPA
ncbi:hypothetical protein [Streptomyces sp. NPDC057115]|uniref:hypothetical protein n=1 Tax=Streptomyces sp. NPDC057115 TaxID=3346022 RepID=UPI003629D14A